MTHDDLLPDSPVTPEEAEAARRLAEALEGGDPLSADPDALSAARLIASVGEAARPADEIRPRRLRRALVAEASGRARRRRQALGLAAAAALAAGLLLPLSRHLATPTTEALLAAREREARAAVERLAAASPDADAFTLAAATVASARRREIWSDLSEERLEALGRASSPGSLLPSSHTTEPTPGGRS